jgi:dihydroorotase
MSRLSIIGGRLLDPASGRDEITDLHIADGRIAAIGKPPAGFAADEQIDARGLWLAPGLVDLWARLCEPGHEHRGTIASETRAAALGGITTLVCTPDTDPVIDETGTVELIHRKAREAGFAHVLPIAALTQELEGKQLAEMATLFEAGCVAVSNANHIIRDTRVMRRAMEYASSFDIPLIIHPHDAYLSEGGCAHEGRIATLLGLPGIPVASEAVALAQRLELVAQTGARVHFSRLSAARSVELIRQAKRDGLPVTADVAIHHLHFTEDDLAGYNAQCHVLPPLRSMADRDGLRAGIADGTLAAVCSDHNPLDSDAKLAPFPHTTPGISALDSLLPLLLELGREMGWSPLETLRPATSGAAGVLGLSGGKLSVDGYADVVLIDPERQWRFSRDGMYSHGRNSPCDGRQMHGRAVSTLFGGRKVLAD